MFASAKYIQIFKDVFCPTAKDHNESCSKSIWTDAVKLSLLTNLDDGLIPFKVGLFCLDTFISVAFPLREAHLIL